jgi:flagellar protein FlaF
MTETDLAELPIARPRGAARAYGQVIRRTDAPRIMERRVFAEITAALETAQAPDTHFVSRIEALQRNRELWIALAFDVADEANPLPVELRAGILNLAIWVDGQSARILRGQGGLDGLIEINRTVMAGLEISPPTAPPET